jgi:hypothetical protein
MNFKNYVSVLYFLLFSVTLYIIHKLLFNIVGTEIKSEQFYYSLEYLYAFFTGMGVLIIFSLIMVFKNAPDFVGMAFLVATNINLIFSYIVVRPILAKTTEGVKMEKINFFGIFILFLAIEIVLTAKMLNNSRKNGQNSKIE